MVTRCGNALTRTAISRTIALGEKKCLQHLKHLTTCLGRQHALRHGLRKSRSLFSSKAAELTGQSLTDFVVACVQETASRMLRDA